MTSTSKLSPAVLENLVHKSIDQKKVFGASFCVDYNGEKWCGASGDLSVDQQYFIASTTKLFVTAIILAYELEGKLRLSDPISKFLDEGVMKDLHLYKGKDFSQNLKVEHLLAHTSGLADYFQQKDEEGKSLLNRLTMEGEDVAWDFEKVIELNCKMKPKFAPGTKGKAHYSDTNFQLLGRIIENISGRSLDQAFDHHIIQPLGLKSTYLYNDPADTRPQHLYFKNRAAHIPKAMASFGADGGIVSTSPDMLIFIKAFFEGFFFPREKVQQLKVWNPIFFPMKSGIGIHRFKLWRIFDPFNKIPELIGHSGLSGALAFYSEKDNLYITGTVNQAAHPDISFRLMIKLVQNILKKK